jgi:hypothetical protein
MKTLSHFLVKSRLILLRTRNISDKNFRENQNPHITFYNFFFRKIVPFMNIGKYGAATKATDENRIRRMRVVFWIRMSTCAHAHAHAHSPGHQNRHTFARSCVHTRTNTQKYEYLLLFHCNKRLAKTPQCYVIRSFLLLL